MKAGLAAPERPLDPAVKASLEGRFGQDLGPVAVHQGPAADAGASALGATAFTVGRHVVLGPGGEASGVLDHEVAHAVQQGLSEPGPRPPSRVTGPGAPEEVDADRAARGSAPLRSATPAIARQTPAGGGVVPPFDRPWAQRWHDFTLERFFGPTPTALTMARDLAGSINGAGLDDQASHGPDLANWLSANGEEDLADRVLEAVRSTWMVRFVSAGPGVPRLSAVFGAALPSDVDGIVTRAEALARAGDHRRAVERLATAYELFSYQVLQAGEDRPNQVAPGAGQAMADFTRSTTYYPAVRHAYDQMRHILGLYFDLEAEARAAGDLTRAATLAGVAGQVEALVRTRSVWTGGQMPTAEVEDVRTAQGADALRIHGANDVTTDVTQLPGLPAPREVTGGGPTAGSGGMANQWQTAESVERSLSAQVALVAELRRQPTADAALGPRGDLNDTATRLRVWAATYAAAESGQAGSGLPALVSLIGRYLQAFTVHTSYNVDDFTQSYLAHDEGTMPMDLAGRLERDCGVYALTVAYEVFRTARGATPRPDLTFQLVALPEHVVLVIVDRANNRFFLVNNDQVQGPTALQGTDLLGAVANAYVGIRGVRNLVSPAVQIDLGTTAQSDAAFKAGAWSQYKLSASWGIHVPPPSPGQTPDQAREAAYRAFYDAQQRADAGADRLDLALDNVVSRLGQTGATGGLPLLNAELPALRTLGYALATTFDQLGPNAIHPGTPVVDATSTSAQRRLAGSIRYLYASQRPSSPHPLARLAMALQLYASLGGVLGPDDNAFLAWCDRVPGFQSAVADYVQRGRPPRF